MKSQAETVAELLTFLAGVPLFAQLNTAALSSLAGQCGFRTLKKGGILFFQSDPSEAVYIVCEGIISIILNSLDGREMVISEMHTGDLFGEVGILTNQLRSTSAIARTDTRLLVMSRQAFLHILQTDHPFSLRLLELVAKRLQLSAQRESALVFLDAQARLARLLLQLEQREQEKGYVTVSQEELAHHTGLIRQTVAKVLGRWRRSGWLITGRGRILILNKKALQDLESNLLV